MSKPVIFLDFDGVLNSLRSTLAFGGCGRHQFDAVAVDLMARLAGKADARVVVSSAWRIGQTVEGLRIILGEYSTTLAARVIGMTPRGLECRGAEIAQWLAENPSEHNRSFVIVDDDADMLDGQLPRFVQTRHRDGIGAPHATALRSASRTCSRPRIRLSASALSSAQLGQNSSRSAHALQAAITTSTGYSASRWV